jgi:hypothetical protein
VLVATGVIAWLRPLIFQSLEGKRNDIRRDPRQYRPRSGSDRRTAHPGCNRPGSAANRLVAVQLATVLTCLSGFVFSFASDQPSIVDLFLALGLLSLPGSLLMAHFLERWL